jgi:PncC family amidohydrolase
MSTELRRLSDQTAKLLGKTGRLVVFAESCTAGLVSASLSRIPGISQFLCGSLVVYQNDTKHAWLGIDNVTLENPGAVSQVVATEMAERALAMTPHANFAASVTGHLGPNAPSKLDGIVYVALSQRKRGTKQLQTSVSRHRLQNQSRQARQREAACLVLITVLRSLESV